MSDSSSDVDQLVHYVSAAADLAFINAYRRNETSAVGVHDAVTEAFRCALGNGLIELRPSDEWPRWIAVDPPYARTDGPST